MQRIENLQLDSYDVSYDYCIIATCDQSEISKSTLYRLLESINFKCQDQLTDQEETLINPKDNKNPANPEFNLDSSVSLTKKGFRMKAIEGIGKLFQKQGKSTGQKILEFKVLRGALNPKKSDQNGPTQATKTDMQSKDKAGLPRASILVLEDNQEQKELVKTGLKETPGQINGLKSNP